MDRGLNRLQCNLNKKNKNKIKKKACRGLVEKEKNQILTKKIQKNAVIDDTDTAIIKYNRWHLLSLVGFF